MLNMNNKKVVLQELNNIVDSLAIINSNWHEKDNDITSSYSLEYDFYEVLHGFINWKNELNNKLNNYSKQYETTSGIIFYFNLSKNEVYLIPFPLIDNQEYTLDVDRIKGLDEIGLDSITLRINKNKFNDIDNQITLTHNDLNDINYHLFYELQEKGE
ncbi:MAG: hypothetical protein ACOC2W_02510 [bacterium]